MKPQDGQTLHSLAHSKSGCPTGWIQASHGVGLIFVKFVFS
jgi:hypothetical protein